MQVPTWRARLLLLLMGAGFLALAARALFLQGLSTEFLQQQGERRYERNLVLPATRGKIFDRSGSVVLASSVPVRAIWAIPEDTRRATDQQLKQIGNLLDMSVKDIKGRLVDEDKNFVYVKRQVSVNIADQIRALKVPGFHQQVEMRRFYPEGDMAAHV